MPAFRFDEPDTQRAYEQFVSRVAPRMREIREFTERTPEDNFSVLKKMLLEYTGHLNFLSYNLAEAYRFYKQALAQEWVKIGDFKGTEERRVRAIVEASIVEPEAIYTRFTDLIKGLQTTLTAVQSNLSAEKSLLAQRME